MIPDHVCAWWWDLEPKVTLDSCGGEGRAAGSDMLMPMSWTLAHGQRHRAVWPHRSSLLLASLLLACGPSRLPGFGSDNEEVESGEGTPSEGGDSTEADLPGEEHTGPTDSTER